MSLTVQLNTMLVMTAMGIWLGLTIDTYGRFVRNRKWYRWIYIINDCVFWLLQALLVFYILLVINQGEMRLYILLALLLGYATYQALLKTIYLSVLEKIIYLTLQTIRFIRTFIFVFFINPTKYLLKVLYTLCMMILSSIIAILLFIWRCVYLPTRWIVNWFGNMFWRLMPNKINEKFKNIAGIFIRVKNLVKRWVSRKDK